MTAADVKALTIEQKIQVMEAIWKDFRERFESLGISDEQKELLDLRRARVQEGKARLLDWESARNSIGKR